MLSFVKKHLNFYLRDDCSFSFIFCIFYLDEKELNQQAYLIKQYVENELSDSTSNKKGKKKKKKKETGAKT